VDCEYTIYDPHDGGVIWRGVMADGVWTSFPETVTPAQVVAIYVDESPGPWQIFQRED
jgi:hypothetical protein